MKSYRERIQIILVTNYGMGDNEAIESLLALCTDIAEDLKEKSERRIGQLPEEGSPIALADKIVNQRSEESDREYGGFSLSMIKTAIIATELCNKVITTEDTFKILIALKLSRLGHSLKLDSFVDAIGYLEGLWNFKQEQKQTHEENESITGFKTVEENISYDLAFFNKFD